MRQEVLKTPLKELSWKRPSQYVEVLSLVVPPTLGFENVQTCKQGEASLLTRRTDH
ncbi:Hypothetical protein FKW44_000307 [Caligus rogercresseyi]|uniref:Uncharacterized protein n=1 Tax=Caligus rogercresseyi TaxID=217165 RepID=A0A7T8KH44_CALRO|nr:Hypothetical protein FKW44_000307 [Caligus rogercresseyi]